MDTFIGIVLIMLLVAMGLCILDLVKVEVCYRNFIRGLMAINRYIDLEFAAYNDSHLVIDRLISELNNYGVSTLDDVMGAFWEVWKGWRVKEWFDDDVLYNRVKNHLKSYKVSSKELNALRGRIAGNDHHEK